MKTNTRYYVQINGNPAVGWSTTYPTRHAALTASVAANRRGIAASVRAVPRDWTLDADGHIPWLIGGPDGLAHQRATLAATLAALHD